MGEEKTKKIICFIFSRYTLILSIFLLPWFFVGAVFIAFPTCRALIFIIGNAIAIFSLSVLYLSDASYEERRLWGFFMLLFPLPCAAAFFPTVLLRTKNTVKASSPSSASAAFPVYYNTSATYIRDGGEYFDMLFGDISEAKKSVYLEYFIISEGILLSKLTALLCQKARRGCEVRIIYDGFGSLGSLSKKSYAKLRAAGVSLRTFNSGIASPLTVHNSRDHRKIAVIDGRIAYTGGINVADEYANLKNRFGHWKDCALRIEGDCAAGMLRAFESCRVGTASLFAKPILFDIPDGKNGAFLPFYSFPRHLSRYSVGKEMYLSIIRAARARLYVTTPYLTYDTEVAYALSEAVARGVDVKIIIPGVKDKCLVGRVTDCVCRKLRTNGIKIYEYQPGFLHQKSVCADGEITLIGTLNLDSRSFFHNFENGVAVRSRTLANDVEEDFFTTLELSELMTDKGRKASYIHRAASAALKLFSPLF